MWHSHDIIEKQKVLFFFRYSLAQRVSENDALTSIQFLSPESLVGELGWVLWHINHGSLLIPNPFLYK